MCFSGRGEEKDGQGNTLFFFFKVLFSLRITKAILQKKNKCASGNVTSLLRSIFANVGIENL